MSTTDRATMIRKAITSETDKVTKIVDVITPEGLDMLEESIGEILTKHKAYHFTRGTDFGHLAVIFTENKYRDAIGDQTFVYADPTDQGAYDTNAGNNTNAAQQAQEEAKYKRKNVRYEVYLGVAEACRDLIIYVVGDNAVASLKGRYVKYGRCSPQAMMKHLRGKIVCQNDNHGKGHVRMR